MSWLNDSKQKIKEKEEIDRRRKESKRLEDRKENRRRFEIAKKLSPMVKKLLKDMAKEQWGINFFWKYYILDSLDLFKTYPDTLWSEHTWSVSYTHYYTKRDWRGRFEGKYKRDYSWKVVLIFGDSEKGTVDHFDGSPTNDTSEQGLKQLLKKKFEAGPSKSKEEFYSS